MDKKILQRFSTYELAEELRLRLKHSNGIEFMSDLQLKEIGIAIIEEEGARDGLVGQSCRVCMDGIKHIH